MQLIFSYGTLQLPQVQLALFKRALKGNEDILLGYKEVELKITDSRVLQMSEKDIHIILEYSGNLKDKVKGMLYEVTDEELLIADGYEVEDYKRIEASFISGKKGWVYVRQ